MKKKIYLVIIEVLSTDFISKEKEDIVTEILLCDTKQFANLVANIDDTQYSILAVDIIDIDSNNNIMKYVKKNPNIEHG